MASYEQRAELILHGVNAFCPKNKTNYYKHDRIIHEIPKHRENKASSINFRKMY